MFWDLLQTGWRCCVMMFFQLITQRRNVKPKQMQPTFNTQVEIAFSGNSIPIVIARREGINKMKFAVNSVASVKY